MTLEPEAEPEAHAKAQESLVWLPAIASRIASFLPPNDVPCTLRLVNKATSEQFSEVNTVQLSSPAPRWAFAKHWLASGACKNLTFKQRQKLVCLVAASGDLSNLAIVIQAAGCTPYDGMLQAAAGAGALECCQRIAEMAGKLSVPAWRFALHAAAKGGHRAVCELCLVNGAERSWWVVAAAYRGGDTELAELLKPEAGDPKLHDKNAMLAGVAESCGLELLKSMWADWGEEVLAGQYIRCTALSAAAGSPTPDWEAKAEFLLANGVSFDNGACSLPHALRLPPATALQRLEWMRGRGWAPDDESVSGASRVGSLAGVGWMLDAGAPVSIMGVELTSLCKLTPPEVVQLLVARGCIAPARVVRSALEAGSPYLPLLRWLVDTYGAEVLNSSMAGRDPEPELGPYDYVDPDDEVEYVEWNFDTVATGGCVAAMELVLEHGAAYGLAFSEASWCAAAGSGCEAALEWLDLRGCPKPDDGRPYAAAAGIKDIRTLRVLRRLGLPWGEPSGADGAFAAAVEAPADLSTLRWLVAEGCPVDWAAAKEAGERRLSRERRDKFHTPWAERTLAAVLAWIKEMEPAATPDGQPAGA